MRIYFLTLIALVLSCKTSKKNTYVLTNGERENIITKANKYLNTQPYTLTKFMCERSQGTINDFYSEGDYWWPDSLNPEGPYIRKDGLTNPDNFVAHREEMWRLSETISYLASAFLLTEDEKYIRKIEEHLTSFFINPATRMNPSLLYGQAIKGLFSGRGIGIIDTIHLIEVARAILRLKQQLHPSIYNELVTWFTKYSDWMTTHQYGIDEMKNGNNHSTWWAAQLLSFASLTKNKKHEEIAVATFKDLLEKQLAKDGSFPEETKRTKPYNYSLFNLEGFTLMCHLAKENNLDLWNYTTKHGSMINAWTFMKPYLLDKSKWPYPRDIEHFEELPISSIGLLLANDYLKLFSEDKTVLKSLPTREKSSQEIKRNFPLINKILWQ